ncbi:Glycosyltransferase involved in cell wall bisynthesis [Saccharicrinis carchari]|uniref:Glycosyltransferase involved in cell wall bisynthesis n=1 Tax=Saccharicrinis carchari TaxID=1168039 RepID=A0A521AKR1_SACCC|nr:glycosyltransferase [Saccharicrinis carchari]SMO35385.1 Glycosyltransferase involved in cell wall bisynthesis [Saccharicrinis carchari]
MKVLHINTHAHGGAFNGAYRLHCALLKNGVKSKMLVLDDSAVPSTSLKEVYTYNEPFRKPNVLNRISTRMGWPVTAQQKRWNTIKCLKGQYEIISFPFSDYDITQSKEFQEADIINFHWFANFLDYQSFFKKCKKPIVITLRDLFSIQGIFHYNNDLVVNQKKFGEVEDAMRLFKSKAISKRRSTITIVGISQWITEQSLVSNIHKHFEHKTISNCIDTNQYQLYDKKALKKEFNISENHTVFSFVSDGVLNNRKGVDILVDAIKKMENNENITFLTVGRGQVPQLPFNIVHRHLGSLNQYELNKVYSVSDAFIFPTKEEALGNVMLEAMACGTPVIGTLVGGLLDVIKPGLNGLFSKDVSAEGIKTAIKEFIEIKNTFDSQKIRSYIQENFSEDLIAKNYTKLYNKILKK